jgi:hypothetical protein
MAPLLDHVEAIDALIEVGTLSDPPAAREVRRQRKIGREVQRLIASELLGTASTVLEIAAVATRDPRFPAARAFVERARQELQ